MENLIQQPNFEAFRISFHNQSQIFREQCSHARAIFHVCARNDPPNFTQASDLPEIGGKSTGMDIDEFTDTPGPNLSVTIKVNRDNVAGGYESYPQTFLGLTSSVY